MSISSTSLFRFVNKFEYLQTIFELGFEFRPQCEELSLNPLSDDIFHQLGIIREELHSLAICFCDLPLSETNDHRKQYGEFTIGMSKAWGMANGITPIRYYHKRSPDLGSPDSSLLLFLAQTAANGPNHLRSTLLNFLADSSCRLRQKDLDAATPEIRKYIDLHEQLLAVALDHFFHSLHLTRTYEGEWSNRINEKIQNRCFYNEREWRAVALKGRSPLCFTLSDVDTIIVSSEAERSVLEDVLWKNKDKLEIGSEREVSRKIQLASVAYGTA